MVDKYKPDGYCGIYCGACPSFQATRSGLADLLGLDQCRGCKSEQVSDGWCSVCDIMSCAKEKNLDFCSDCSAYPCDILLNFKENSSVPMHNEVLDSLTFIKELGKETWLKAMDARWRCTSCGTVYSYFSMYCACCGLKVRKRRGIP